MAPRLNTGSYDALQRRQVRAQQLREGQRRHREKVKAKMAQVQKDVAQKQDEVSELEARRAVLTEKKAMLKDGVDQLTANIAARSAEIDKLLGSHPNPQLWSARWAVRSAHQAALASAVQAAVVNADGCAKFNAFTEACTNLAIIEQACADLKIMSAPRAPLQDNKALAFVTPAPDRT